MGIYSGQIYRYSFLKHSSQICTLPLTLFSVVFFFNCFQLKPLEECSKKTKTNCGFTETEAIRKTKIIIPVL